MTHTLEETPIGSYSSSKGRTLVLTLYSWPHVASDSQAADSHFKAGKVEHPLVKWTVMDNVSSKCGIEMPLCL